MRTFIGTLIITSIICGTAIVVGLCQPISSPSKQMDELDVALSSPAIKSAPVATKQAKVIDPEQAQFNAQLDKLLGF